MYYKWQFKHYLKSLGLAWASSEDRIRKVESIEKHFNMSADDIVSNDADMAFVVQSLYSKGRQWAKSKVNAIHHYYKFINGKNFILSEFKNAPIQQI